MNNKFFKYLNIYFLIFILLINLCGCANKNNTDGTYTNNTDNSVEIQNSVKLLKNLENKDISKIEKNIDYIQKQLYRSNTHKSSANSSKSKYKYIFESTVFMGDSQAEPLSLYGFLDSSSVVAKKGRNVISAKEDVPSVVKLNPKKIVLLYGVNDLLLFKTTDDFILKYEKLILSLKKQLPDTKIYVNAVYHVQDFACVKKPLFKRSSDFNESLKQLCDKLSVTYIDSNVLVSNDSEYYAPDGIHFYSSYYYPWLDFMQKQLGL